jgi:hypothetical protein
MSQVSSTYGPILWTPCYADQDGKPVQVVAWGDQGFSFGGSIFFGGAGESQADDDYLVTYIPGGAPDAAHCLMTNLLVPWVANNVTLIDGNTTLLVDPQFANPGGLDFHPTSGSPMIDNGVFLARTTSAGSGTVIPVDDAGDFFDGYGIAGETGDVIQLEGQTSTARVVAVDLTNSTLTVDQALSWEDGQGVSLAYAGSAPDIGAFEYGLP